MEGIGSEPCIVKFNELSVKRNNVLDFIVCKNCGFF